MPVLKPIFGVFAVVGWLVLMGLHVVWRSTFGWLFKTLADFLDVGIPLPRLPDVHPFGAVAGWLRSLDRNVDAGLVKAANNLEHVAVWLFSRVGFFVGWLASEIAGLALAVEHKFARFARVTIPNLLRGLLKVVWRELRKVTHYARKMIPNLLRRIVRYAKWATHEIAKGARHLGFLWKWVKATLRAHWRVISGALKRLRHLERRLVPKGFRKLLIGALGPLGLLWLFTDNVIRIGKALARLDRGAVYEWIQDAWTIATTTDMCKLAAYQFDLAVFIFDPVMQEVIGLVEWFCFHSGDTLPSATTARPGYAGAWAPSATPPIAPLNAQRRLAPGVPLPRGVIHV